ncbi:MAG: hypothetical protein DRQ98_14145, partial [Gammaproteobacteria bacterium]
ELPLTTNSLALLAIGGQINVSMAAEAGRTGSASIRYERWINPLEPSGGTETAEAQIGLTENPESPGSYRGSWILPDSTSRVDAIEGMLTDGFGSEVSLQVSGFPLAVEAFFEITVEGSEDDFATGMVFSLWSETAQAGCSRAITGATSIEKGGLPPGADYRLRVLQGNRVVQSLEDVVLHSGLVTTLEQSLQPATAALFALKDMDGTSRGGFLISLYEVDTDRLIGWGEAGEDGMVDAAPGLVFIPGSEVIYRLQREPWDISSGPHAITIPDLGMVGNLTMERSDQWLPPARIAGKVTYPDGSPVRIFIRAGSVNPGIIHHTGVLSEDDGSFILEPVYGQTFVSVAGSDRGRSRWFFKQTVDVTGGGTTNLNIQLEKLTDYTVRVEELELQYASDRSVTVRPGEFPIASRIRVELVEDDRLFNNATRSGDATGLSVDLLAKEGTHFTLSINAAEIGFDRVSLPILTGGDPLIIIPSVQLHMNASSYLTANLVAHDGQPIDPDQLWHLTYRNSQQGSSTWLTGSGPQLEFPVPQESSGIRISPGAGLLGQIELPGPFGPGENDLGTLRFEPQGFVANWQGSSYRLSPDVLLKNSLVYGDISLKNPLTKPLTNCEVHLEHGAELKLVANSAIASGEPVEGNTTETGTTYRLPSIASGEFLHFRFMLEVTDLAEQSNIVVPAALTFGSEGAAITESIGIETILLIQVPTITGPSVVPTEQVELSGRSRIGTLRIFDDGELIGQTEVSHGGFWTVTTDLAVVQIPYWHTLTAELTDPDGNTTRSESFEVLHNPLLPRPLRVRFKQPLDQVDDAEEARLILAFTGEADLLTEFGDILQWKEHEVPETGVPRFWYRMLAGFPFDFEVEFDRPDLVSNLSVEIMGPAGGIGSAELGS